MMSYSTKRICDWTEADESAHSKDVAITNFQFQVEQDETMGIRQMYESAARHQGATDADIKAAYERGRAFRMEGR